jgi:hypothetical protein
MSLYFFHFRDQTGLHRDSEGAEHPDDAAALFEAMALARARMANTADSETLDLLGMTFEVANGTGKTLYVISAAEAILLG